MHQGTQGRWSLDTHAHFSGLHCSIGWKGGQEICKRLIGTVEESDVAIGIEVRARVSNKQGQEEQEHVNDIRRLLGQDWTPRQWRLNHFSVEANPDEFTKLVGDTHEAVHVLHHAYVYGFDTVLLLVDNKGGILYGMFVHVTAAIRTAYGEVLKDLHTLIPWLGCTTQMSCPASEWWGSGNSVRVCDCEQCASQPA